MPRWEDGSKDRLKNAAMELFEEQGFENTSVVQISERARVTTRTFFRYFSDKREVLFADSDELRRALVEKIRQTSDIREPLQTVVDVLSNFGWEKLGSRKFQRQRQAVIAANPGLLERDLMKNHGIALELIDALQQRGVDKDRARLAAQVGIQLFLAAYVDWLEAGPAAELTAMSEGLTSLLVSILPTRVQPISKPPKSNQRRRTTANLRRTGKS